MGTSSTSWLVQNEGRELVGTVTDVGKGFPVVFLHGLVGLNEHWEGVVDRVCHSVRCTLFELPLLQLRGGDCSVQGVTRFTTAFLRQRLTEPAVLVGNSFGGHIALRIALESPDLVRGLVLAGLLGLIEKTMVREITVRPSREWLVRKIGELFYDQSFMRDADVDRAHRELSDRGGARAMGPALSLRPERSPWASASGGSISPPFSSGASRTSSRPPEAADEFQVPSAQLASGVVRSVRGTPR